MKRDKKSDRLLYDECMKLLVSSADNWKAVCRMTDRIYRYEFNNILMVYMQRLNATLVADYDTYLGRQNELQKRLNSVTRFGAVEV